MKITICFWCTQILIDNNYKTCLVLNSTNSIDLHPISINNQEYTISYNGPEDDFTPKEVLLKIDNDKENMHYTSLAIEVFGLNLECADIMTSMKIMRNETNRDGIYEWMDCSHEIISIESMGDGIMQQSEWNSDLEKIWTKLQVYVKYI